MPSHLSHTSAEVRPRYHKKKNSPAVHSATRLFSRTLRRCTPTFFLARRSCVSFICLIARAPFEAAGTLGGPDEGVLTTALVGCGRPADSYGVDLRIVDTEVCVVCVTL